MKEGIIMEKICPVCNEVSSVNVICNSCNKSMTDKGRVEEYLDSYSGEMQIDDSEDNCIHIYKCLSCNYFKRVQVSKVNI
jgi:hypothetical protein